MNPPSSIAEVIAAEGGRVTFARFMELALTHPTLGYYSRADRVLGRRGDFSTAPALSPFFNRMLARLVTELLDASLSAGGGEPAVAARPSVVELGGGEGQLAAAILGSWQQQMPGLREKVAYRIVEVGAGLRELQAEALGGLVTAGWDVGWGVSLAEACTGTRPAVIVGNEFLDTTPVHLVRVADGRVEEAWVRGGPDGALDEVWGPLSEGAASEIELLFGAVEAQRLGPLTGDGFIEVFPGLGGLVAEVAAVMPAGSFVNVDYGAWLPGIPGTGEPWGQGGPARRRGTVRGYFKHQMEPDPLARPGRQDLTADVDFAALDLHGRRVGFETVLFTTLARFLAAGGAAAEVEALSGEGAQGCRLEDDALEADRQATILRDLLDESDLGTAFKLMVQVRE